MNIIHKWIKALRSKKYKQGMGRLRCGDKFCCLGVLGDLLDPSAWDGNTLTHEDERYDCYLPESILKLRNQKAFSSMNDSRASFNTIASEVERMDKRGEITINTCPSVT